MQGAYSMNQHTPVSLDWTFEQAQAAQDTAMIDGPGGPLYQWCALHKLERLRKEFAAGDRFALMSAIRVCANHDLPMPDWVARAYIAGFDSVLNYRVASWDDAFGRPFPQGKQLAKARCRRMLKFAVLNRAIELMKQGRSINAAFFREIGRSFGIKKTTTEVYFRAAIASMHRPAAPGIDRLLEQYMSPQAKRARATRKVQKLRGSR